MGKAAFRACLIIGVLLEMFFGSVICSPVYAYSSYGKSPVQQHTATTHSDKKVHGELIILVHGLMRTSMSMSLLKAFLEHQGYTVYSYSYPSPSHSIHEHSLSLQSYIDKLAKNYPGVTIHFITHSLGGIIVREALAQIPDEQRKNMGFLIMLAPPNQGSSLAKLSLKILPAIAYFIKPLAELSSDPSSYVHRVPIPQMKIGIIAGRFDAKVPPSSAKLNGTPEFVVINSTHTFIMNDFKAQKLILNFLEQGSFNKPPQ
ncbi:esterase/lipase family protein [Legionella worsleiensis]|uniref:Lipase B n=1 Tax=Legionella worsleiensis TaxID=45076 RepID=A0A0W1AAF4_9GAMM|nr:lipase B [Legionella worsleiensis]STY32581.1 lipase B [Legionella worsleiensis]